MMLRQNCLTMPESSLQIVNPTLLPLNYTGCLLSGNCRDYVDGIMSSIRVLYSMIESVFILQKESFYFPDTAISQDNAKYLLYYIKGLFGLKKDSYHFL